MNRDSKLQFKSIEDFLLLAPPDPTKPNLGHGSYGVVKLAKHLRQNNKYALKIVKKIKFLIINFFLRLIARNFMDLQNLILFKEKSKFTAK